MPGAWFDNGYIPSFGGFGATACIRQSLARCWVLLRNTRTTGFWETTLCFRISAMRGTTVGTCAASAVSVHAASSSKTVVWLVLRVKPWRLCSSWLAQAKIFSILAGMVLMDSSSDMYKAGYAGYNTPRAVLSFPVCRLVMLGIMAGMDQKVLFSMCKAWFAGF